MNPEELLLHAGFVRSLARSLVLDEHTAADLSQATWLSLLKHPPAEGKPVRPWLARVLRNLRISSFRTESRRKKRERVVARPEGLPSTEEVVEKMETRRLLIEAVLDLPEPYRSTMIFRYYDGYSSREIANRLGLPLETVRTRVKRGLDQLRKQLDHLHDNDRARWCLALMPLAGLGFPEASALTLTATIKICLVLASAVTLVFTFFSIFDRNEPAKIEEKPEAHPLAVEPAERDTTLTGEAKREPLPPTGDSLDMPSSFREALVGYQGRVIDGFGKPLPGKAINMYSLNSLDLLGEFDLAPSTARSEEDGTFCIEDIDPRGYCLLQVAGEGIRLVDIQPNPGEIADIGDVVIETGNVLAGWVQDGEDNPLGGVRIRATQLPPMIFNFAVQDMRKGCSILFEKDPLFDKKSILDLPDVFFQLLDKLPFPSTITAGDGSFRLEALPSGPVTLVADKQGYVPKIMGTMVSAKKNEHEVMTIILEHGLFLKGRVLDNLGRPVPGAEIRVGLSSGNPYFSVLQHPVTTDEEGVFTARGDFSNLIHVAVRRGPGDPWFFPDPFFHDDSEALFHLPSTTDLQVITGVENANVKIRENAFQNIFIPFPFHELESFNGLLPGLYEVQVTAPGYSSAYETFALTDRAIVKEVALEQAFEAELHVTAGQGGIPLARADVFAMPEGSDLFKEMSKLIQCRTDETGLAVLRNVAPERYRVTVSHPGYALFTTVLDMPCKAEIEVPMEAGGIFEGKISLQGSFTLILESLVGDGYPEFLALRLFATDPDGTFRVANLHPGTWNVNVMERLFGKRPLEVFQVFLHGPIAQRVVNIRAGETLRLDIAPGGPSRQDEASISGSVILDGNPVRGAEVILTADGKTFSSVTDGIGVYTFSRVPPGDHRLEARIPPELNLKRVIRVDEHLPSSEDFDLITGALFGRVISHGDGRPLGGVQIKARLMPDSSPLKERLRQVIDENDPDVKESALSLLKESFIIPVELKTTTAVDGTFRFDRAPVGVYSIKTEETGFGNKTIEAIGVKYGEYSGPVIIEVRSPVLVRGRVELAREIGENHDLYLVLTPLDFDPSSLFLEGKLEGFLLVPVDDKTGTFVIEDAVPGSYQASFSITSYNRSKRWEEKSIEPLKIEVPPGGARNLVLTPKLVDN